MTESFVVQGQKELKGSVPLPAAKNGVLPLMAAALLCDGPVRLRGAPHIADVETGCEILRALGATAAWQNGELCIDAAQMDEWQLPPRQAGAMRGSVFYLAPVLCRMGRILLPMPGGCRLGPRPIDIHLDGLTRMGARVRWQDQSISLQTDGVLHAVDYTLRLPSVGASETLMMAASVAAGTTVLRNVACEPEVCDLAAFLNRCGAHIRGAGTPVLVIEGVRSLAGCNWTPVPDRIVGCTLLAAAACAGGRVRLENARPRQMQAMLDFLGQVGCEVESERQSVTVTRSGPLQGDVRIVTGSYPEFSSDAAPLAAAVLLFVNGEGSVRDTMFERRFLCAPEFVRMGGAVCSGGGEIRITGGKPLYGTEVTAADLRGGAALVLAALGAGGESRIRQAEHIRRGYQGLETMLGSLGACIRYEIC